MSPETFLTLMFLYMVFQTIVILFFLRDSETSNEDRDRRNTAEDVRRIRTLEDIKYYREIFRDRDKK